jgi:hypothetical protein
VAEVDLADPGAAVEHEWEPADPCPELYKTDGFDPCWNVG